MSAASKQGLLLGRVSRRENGEIPESLPLYMSNTSTNRTKQDQVILRSEQPSGNELLSNARRCPAIRTHITTELRK